MSAIGDRNKAEKEDGYPPRLLGEIDTVVVVGVGLVDGVPGVVDIATGVAAGVVVSVVADVVFDIAVGVVAGVVAGVVSGVCFWCRCWCFC